MEELFVSVDNFVLADSAFSLGTASWCQNFCVSLPVSFVSGRVPRIRKEKKRKDQKRKDKYVNVFMYLYIYLPHLLTHLLIHSNLLVRMKEVPAEKLNL